MKGVSHSGTFGLVGAIQSTVYDPNETLRNPGSVLQAISPATLKQPERPRVQRGLRMARGGERFEAVASQPSLSCFIATTS
ncbi:MAG TPA: hypothetical protein DEP35_20205 [Deltaproteobacteria bacterium]|nr:hypothetical protein [Deltaproteobacteria bacterium]